MDNDALASDGGRVSMSTVIGEHIRALVHDNDFMTACVAVTADGHLVAGAQKRDYSLDRLSAIGSTFMALGDTVANELKMGGCKDVISELDGGIVVFMHLTRNVAIAAVSDSTRSLGLLLSSTRGCIDNVLRDLRSQKTTSK